MQIRRPRVRTRKLFPDLAVEEIAERGAPWVRE
jgi:hypothetical protein